MSTDEIIDAENEPEITEGADEQLQVSENEGHSKYKVPKISDDAIKHHLSEYQSPPFFVQNSLMGRSG
jgi:hypothetical protein